MLKIKAKKCMLLYTHVFKELSWIVQILDFKRTEKYNDTLNNLMVYSVKVMFKHQLVRQEQAFNCLY